MALVVDKILDINQLFFKFFASYSSFLMILWLVDIFIHVLDIINSTGRNICTIEDWHREEYYVQKKTDSGQKVAFHRYVSGTKHREMHFQTCRVTYHIILDGIYRGASTMELLAPSGALVVIMV